MYARILLLLALTLNLPHPSAAEKLAWATFYGGPGGGVGSDNMDPNEGACGYGDLRRHAKGGSHRWFAAVNDKAPDFNMNCRPNPYGGGNPVCDGAACGKCLAVKCVSKVVNHEMFTVKGDGFDGQQVCKPAASENHERVAVVMITDACPSDHPNNARKGANNKCGRNYNALDISWDAFHGIADVSAGQVHVRMDMVDCSTVSLGVHEVAKDGGMSSGVRAQGRKGRKLMMASAYTSSTQFVGTNATLISVD